MPHAIYLHSALTQGRMPCRDESERGRVLRFERTDVILALGVAGLINVAMLAVAAQLFHTGGHSGSAETLQGVHTGLSHLVGGGAALAFAVALFASGASSSSVGTYAGQVVMSGFVKVRISLYVRRLVTMLPALVILALGVSPTSALILSQVVLSFGIPFALIPLVLLTSRRDVMGGHVNQPLTTRIAWAMAALIVALNVFLLCQQFFLKLRHPAARDPLSRRPRTSPRLDRASAMRPRPALPKARRLKRTAGKSTSERRASLKARDPGTRPVSQAVTYETVSLAGPDQG